jgi:hypothetical protein
MTLQLKGGDMESGNYLEGMNANEFGCKAVERWRVGHG